MSGLRGRLLAAAGVVVAAWAVLALLGYGPRALPVAVLGLVAVLALGAAYDAVVWHGPRWPQPGELSPVRSGSDRHVAAYQRLLDSNATAKVPDERLQDLLGRLVDLRLEQRHGLTREDPEAAGLLGRDLLALLNGRPRRVPSRELDAHLRRIEAL